MSQNIPSMLDPTNTRELQVQQIKSVMQNVFSSLVDNQMRQKLPESVFVQTFLPYFSGQIKAGPNENPVAQWIGVAGSPTSEVELIDNQGKVVAIVPAIFNTDFINPNKIQGNGLYRIAQQHELEKTNPINNSNNVFANQLLSRVPQAQVSQTDSEKWDILLSRYGLSEKNKNDLKSKESKQVSGSDEELDFGDL